jgi:2-hydroxy-3-keto-5-methylthiopentenyl-1-phosphate phosphatase
VFIGDGLSDYAPAAVADEVFAKPALARYCRAQGVPCEVIGTFDDVVRSLDARLSGRR